MPKDKEDEKTVDYKKLNSFLESLPDHISQSMTAALRTAVKEENDRRTRQQEEEDDDDDFEDDDDDEVDVDSLSRKELIAHINKMNEKGLARVLKPLMKQIEGLSNQTEADRMKQEFVAAKAKYSDLPQWKDELLANMKRNKDLSVEDAYLLARSKNPDKAKEIDTKAAQEAEEKERTENPKKPFGGLMPTSGVKSEDDNTGKMDQTEASEKAWDQAMAGVPEEIIGTHT